VTGCYTCAMLTPPLLNRRRVLQFLLAVPMLTGSRLAAATLKPWTFPDTYPTDYADIIAAARREGQLSVLSSTDRLSANPLLKAFEAAYPGIRTSYKDLNTREVDRQFRSEASAGAVTDLVWSSAMDTQIQLVKGNFALPYQSPEARNLPSWAEWQGAAYGLTYEPTVIAYNRNLVKADEVPQNHADFTRLLASNAERFRGKVLTYDIEKSAAGFLLAAQDALANSAYPQLLQALSATGVRFVATGNEMLESVANGSAAFAYNMFGSYAEIYARRFPASVGYVIPLDYSLVLSRVMFIARSAPHPNAARLFLDFALSSRGQTVMATDSGLGSVRADIDGDFTLRRLRQNPRLQLRPIGVSASLLATLDPARREVFVAQWRKDIGKN
jgi:iron(III) transport system substrate-binding protein